MNRPKVVIDTNVLVSAAIKPKSNEEAVLLLVSANRVVFFVSPPIMSEYEAVLRRPKFKLDRERVDLLLNLIPAHAIVVMPTRRLSISPDEADNRFLECAEAAGADYLVTGNKRDFPTHWEHTEILAARELLDRLSSR